MVTATCAPPRVQLTHHAPVSRAEDVYEMAELVGFDPDPWQRMVIDALSGQDLDGKWLPKEGAMNVPRQNGKGGVLELLELTALFTWLPEIEAPGERLIIHSAHEFITSQKHFDRVWALVENSPLIKRVVRQRPIRSHGHEGFRTTDGCQIEFRTRTKGGGRGFSCDWLVFDECMFLPESAMGALWPTLRARPNPRVIYAGSAVDQEVHHEGLVFTRVRQRALERDSGLVYFEWSLEYDHPDEVPEEVYHDEDAYWRSNPAYGIRIFPEHFHSEIAALERRTAAVELLGVGDYPDPSGSDLQVIPHEKWLACLDESSRIVGTPHLAFDVSPERRGSIAAAGRNADGRLHVEVIEKLPGTGWLPARLAELVAKHEPERVVCDDLGPGKGVVKKIEDAGVKVTSLSGAEHAQACGFFVDQVSEDNLRHLGSIDLSNAIRSARTRPLGDRWLWSRRSSMVDISPLVAATLALWSAGAEPDDDEGPIIY